MASANAEFVSGMGVRRPAQRMILMGPPGSGKSTVGQALADSMGVPLISTGDLLRQHALEGTDIGKRAQPYVDSGKYAPDEVVTQALQHRLAVPDAAAGFVLDGYPRTKAQAQGIDNLSTIDKVLYLDLPTDVSLSRIAKRGKTSGRADDDESVARERMSLYARETQPVADMYEKQGRLDRIDAQSPWKSLRGQQ